VDRRPRLLGDLELNWPAGFLLNHRGAIAYLPSDVYVADAEPDEVAAPQLAVDGEIEQGEIAAAISQSVSPAFFAKKAIWTPHSYSHPLSAQVRVMTISPLAER
jgi:hypothetical protein